MKVGNYTIDKSQLLIKAISGSRAYGLSTPQSDTDIKGVFIQSKKEYFGLYPIEQVSNETNDIVYYELKRFFELLLKNNPNIIELLASPFDCILYKNSFFDLIKPEKVLSKLCKQTFVLYAEAQLKKAKGLNKKIVNPIDKERKSVADFCFVVHGSSTVPLNLWLKKHNFNQQDCGLVSLPHMKDMFAIFHNSQLEKVKLNGIYSGFEANDVLLSSIPIGIEPLATMGFNKDGYSFYCREYKEYWDWVSKRNNNRYQNTISEEKNYDTKNMMHVFRLLDMAEHIAKEGRVVVVSEKREFLLSIKAGEFSYDYLLKNAIEKISTVNSLFDNSFLPDTPDENHLQNVLFEIREGYYNHS